MTNKILIVCANILYFFLKLIPSKNKITMISRQSDTATVDFKLLEDEIKKTNRNVKVCILCHKLEGGEKAKLSEKMRYILHCFNQMYHIATSKVLILDSYCILASILKHKKKLKIIQMWHSMGTMKKFGYQIIGKEEGTNKKTANDMKMHKNYDYVFASSMEYAKELAEGFDCKLDKIRIYSLPRVDLLTSEEYKHKMNECIANRYPQINKKKNIVYCPTFRKDEKQFEQKINDLVDSIDYEQYNLIIKLHPLSKVNISNSKVIVDKEFSSMQMLFVADYVISDYSCIIYEAAILNIPLYFYAFDLDKYLNVRGLTFDYKKELPGIISDNIEDIISAINSREYDYERLHNFRKKYVKNTENCSKAIVDFVMNLM